MPSGKAEISKTDQFAKTSLSRNWRIRRDLPIWLPADDGHQVALAGSRPLERSSQDFGFAAAANERAEAARDTGRPAAALLHAVLKVIGLDRRGGHPLDRDVAQRARRYVALGELYVAPVM